MSEGISFRPRLGHLTINIIMMVFLLGFLMFFYIMIMSLGDIPSGMFLPLIIPFAVCVASMMIVPTVFFLRIKYILKDNTLIVKRYFKTIEIYYASIKSVEEVVDYSVFIINLTPSVASSKQILIKFTDINGREDVVNISPAKKQEFLSMLRARIKDPEVFMPRGERQANVNYQNWKNFTPKKKWTYIVYFAVIIAISVAVIIL